MKHVRYLAAALLVLLLAMPIAAQATGASSNGRTTAYTNKNTYVYKKASKSSGKKSVAANTKVYVLGKSGSFCKVQNASGSTKGYMLTSCLSASKTASKTTSKTAAKTAASPSWTSKVVKMNWFQGGSSVLKKNGYGYLYDVSTGVTMRIKRMGGSKHADVEPATASDTAKLLKIARGKFSWDSHAVILRVGSKYVACAINTMPHGDQTISNNNYDGQFCLHMTNSTTHGSGEVNANHQAAIEKAYAWAHQ